METKSLSKVEQEKLKSIMNDPVLWAKTHIITYDNALKKFIEKHNDFTVVPIKKYNFENFIYGELGLTILPDERFDGFFISKMIKR